MAVNRWLRPEVYPLFAAVGAAIGICGFQLVRNIRINPEVSYASKVQTFYILLTNAVLSVHLFSLVYITILTRVSKQGRAAGVLENYDEGQKYAEHSLRKFVRNRRPEIMPAINSFFTEPEKN